MDIVKKFKIGDSVKVLKSLSNSEITALHMAFVKNKGSKQQKDTAESVAEYMKDREGWICCDCNQAFRPVMTVGLSIKGNYYLQRINQRGDHSEKCPFKGVDRQHSSGASSLKPCSNKVPLRLHRRGNVENSSSKSEATESKTASKKYHSRLARILYTWVNEAGVNKISSSDFFKICDQFKNIRDIAHTYYLDTKVKASYFLWTYPDVERAANQLKEREHYWPKKARPYGLCVGVVDKIDGNSLFFKFKDKEISVDCEGEVKKSSGRLGENSPPFLAIFTITDTLKELGTYKPYNAFCVPVYSKSRIIPIDSDYERRVLSVLETRAKWWREKGVNVSIIKPLFDIKEFLDGELCASKPDFLIETPGITIVFEVMGSHEPEYIERKSRTVEFMRAIGEVIEFDALAADRSGDWDECLKSKIRQVSAILFKNNINN